MKYFILISSLILSCLSLAETNIDLTPVFPADCSLRKHNVDYLNEIGDIERVQEDDRYVTFRFISNYTSCEEGEIKIRALRSDGDVRLDIVKKKLFAGSEKGIVKKVLTVISESEVQIDLTFDKNVCLKGRLKAAPGSQVSKAYDMYFHPGDTYKQLYMSYNRMYEIKTDISFAWGLLLIETLGQGSTLQRIY